MLLSFATAPVLIVTPQLDSWRGGVEAAWPQATTRTVYGTVQPLDPGVASERYGIASQAREVALPSGTALAATDRLRFPGEPGGDWEIVREPQEWVSPTGALSHVLVVCQRIGGDR